MPKPVTITGVIPIQTDPPPAEYSFSGGAWIESQGISAAAERIFEAIPTFHSVSENEAWGITTKQGALLLQRDIRYQKPAELLSGHQSLLSELRTLRWCIDLAGCGENRIWYTAGCHNCAIYLHCPAETGFDGAWRQQPIYRTPTADRRDIPWSEDRLRLADELLENIRASDDSVPRIDIADRFRQVACTLSAYDMTARFQLTVSALETFYIDPGEYDHLWKDPIRSRVREITAKDGLSVPDSYFDSLGRTRADAVHRGGIERATQKRPRFYNVHCWSEDILAATLRWAHRNRELLAQCFNAGTWVS